MDRVMTPVSPVVLLSHCAAPNQIYPIYESEPFSSQSTYSFGLPLQNIGLAEGMHATLSSSALDIHDFNRMCKRI